MRSLLLLVVGFLLVQLTHASEYPKLHIKISGETTNKQLFLCVGNVGCVSILAGNKGKEYPMENGSINYIYTTSVATMQLYPQELPASCDIAVKENQTVTITGHMVKGKDQKMHINNLNCSVA